MKPSELIAVVLASVASLASIAGLGLNCALYEDLGVPEELVQSNCVNDQYDSAETDRTEQIEAKAMP